MPDMTREWPPSEAENARISPDAWVALRCVALQGMMWLTAIILFFY